MIVWFFSVVFAALPFLVAIAQSPSGLSSLFASGSYAMFYGELLFYGVSVGGVALADFMDALVKGRITRLGTFAATLSALASLTLLVTIVLMSVWYGIHVNMDIEPLQKDVDATLVANGLVVLLAFVLRLLQRVN